jgi:hypothetical protein
MLAEKQFSLTPSEVEQFRKQGFLGPFAAFAPEEMEDIRKVIYERVLPTPTPYDTYGRARYTDSETIWRLCSAPAIVDRMASIYGPDLLLWACSFFHKPPARGVEYPWHQDVTHWFLEPSISLSAWIALTPATVENGCVEVIPGSHKRLLPTVKTADSRYDSRFDGQAADPAAVDERNKVPLVMKPGEFFLFNERTVHRSGSNQSREVRFGISARVTLPMVKSYHPWPCVMLRGKDSLGFNTYVEPPKGEPDIARWPGGLPDARKFTFDRAVPGLGWHLCEMAKDTPFCWTGPEKDSWIALRVAEGGDRRFRCRIISALEPDTMKNLRIRVNSFELPLQVRPWRPGGAEVEAYVPAHALEERGDIAQVSFHVNRTRRPCDVYRSNPDVRQLGVAIHEIELGLVS